MRCSGTETMRIRAGLTAVGGGGLRALCMARWRCCSSHQVHRSGNDPLHLPLRCNTLATKPRTLSPRNREEAQFESLEDCVSQVFRDRQDSLGLSRARAGLRLFGGELQPRWPCLAPSVGRDRSVSRSSSSSSPIY